jgi:hypothetical protein
VVLFICTYFVGWKVGGELRKVDGELGKVGGELRKVDGN